MARISLIITMLSSALVVGLALIVVAEVEVDDSSPNDLTIMSIESSEEDVGYPTKCPKVDPQNETIVLPYNGDCTKYYACFSGRKTVMDCPEYNVDHDKLHFNPETHQCDWPENVNCVQSELFSEEKVSEARVSLPILPEATTTADSEATTTSDSEATTTFDSEATTTSDSEATTTSDSEATTTSDSEATTTSDSEATTTSDSEATTTSDSEATTTSDSEATTTSDPEATTTSGVEDCVGTCPEYEPETGSVALPHKDCRKFCLCEENGERVFPCPAELEFSPTLKVCTSPEYAGCEGDHSSESQESDERDEALMSVLNYRRRFRW